MIIQGKILKNLSSNNLLKTPSFSITIIYLAFDLISSSFGIFPGIGIPGIDIDFPLIQPEPSCD